MKKSILNIIRCTGFLFLLIGVSNLQASTEECSQEDIQHYIFIHGIGSSGTMAFGVMREAIETHIDCTKAYHFEYETKNSSLTTHDFAKDLNLLLETLPKTNKKNINLIMHSQGGLVGLKWMINSIRSYHGFSRKIVERVNRYITFATPFWGSDLAMMGNVILFSGLSKNSISPFGKLQLEQIEYGSPVFFDTAHVLSQNWKGAVSEFLRNEVKMLNITGMGPYSSTIMSKLGGSQKFEGDYFVNTPSSQINFNFGRVDNYVYESSIQETAKMKPHDIAKQSYVLGTHANIYSFLGGSYGLAELPKKCLELRACDHPGYETLLTFIQTGEVITDTEIAKVIQGFELHVELDFYGAISDPQAIELMIK
ncbi:MAG: hypothetical protein HON90_17830, partial [Halobacteriovoraceae bacterium]|nr:hypothetical protein [Halobacteriovoraceae bacterium]